MRQRRGANAAEIGRRLGGTYLAAHVVVKIVDAFAVAASVMLSIACYDPELESLAGVPDSDDVVVADSAHAPAAQEGAHDPDRSAATGDAVAVMAAADDDDPSCKLGSLKDDFFASAAVCGFEAIQGAGNSFVKDVAKNLARSALVEISPGLADLLLGPRDPFAAGVERILAAIGSAEQNIIANQVELVEDEVGDVSIPTVRTILEDLSFLDLTGKYGRFLGGEYTGLHLELTRVQQALQNRYDVFGLRSLHVLTTVVGWAVMFEPEFQVLTEIAGRGVPPRDLSDDELRDIQVVAAAETDEGLANLLDGSFGFLRYVRGLASPNRFRQESEAQFSDFKECRDRSGVRICRYEVSQLPDRTRTVGEETREDFLIKVERISASTVEVTSSTLEPYGCDWGASPPDCIARPFDSYRIDNDASLATLMDREYTRLRDRNYHLLLAGGYGPIRPTVDGWYRLIGRSPVQTDLDRDLDDFMFDDGGVGSALDRLVGALADRTFTTAESRTIVNYALLFGNTALEEVAGATGENPWGTTAADFIRFLAGLSPSGAAEGVFRGQFVARLSVVI